MRRASRSRPFGARRHLPGLVARPQHQHGLAQQRQALAGRIVGGRRRPQAADRRPQCRGEISPSRGSGALTPRERRIRCHSSTRCEPSSRARRGHGRELKVSRSARRTRARRQHHAAHLLGARHREFDRRQRPALVAEHVHLAQAQRIEQVDDRARLVGDLGRLRRRIRFAATRQVRRVGTAVAAEVLQQRAEHAAGLRGGGTHTSGVSSSKPPLDGKAVCRCNCPKRQSTYILRRWMVTCGAIPGRRAGAAGDRAGGKSGHDDRASGDGCRGVREFSAHRAPRPR